MRQDVRKKLGFFSSCSLGHIKGFLFFGTFAEGEKNQQANANGW